MIDSEGMRGRPSACPTSIMSGVANRQGNAATASPAESAAVTAEVPPINTSVQGIDAPSNKRVATSRTVQQVGWLASGNGSA